MIVRQSSENALQALQELVNHLFDKRWREVFLLATAMSSNADRLVLLMKEKIDSFLAQDEKLQEYLEWLKEKTTTVNIEYAAETAQEIHNTYNFYADTNITLSRIIYFDLDLNRNLKPIHSLNLNLYQYLSQVENPRLDVDLHLYLCLFLYQRLKLNLNFNPKLAQQIDADLYDALLNLKAKLPDEKTTTEIKFKEWWLANGQAWSKDFRNAMIKYRNIGHDWQFSEAQKNLLEQYYLANQLLTQCLHHECYVSREVRQYIEETLLLPIAEIEKIPRP